MIPALPYLSTHIHLAEGSDHPGHTLSQVFFPSVMLVGGGGRGHLPTPKCLTGQPAGIQGVVSLASVPSLAMIFSSGVDPCHPDRWCYGAKRLVWAVFLVLCQSCLWPWRQRNVGSRTRLPETVSLHHFLIVARAWQSSAPHPTVRCRL